MQKKTMGIKKLYSLVVRAAIKISQIEYVINNKNISVTVRRLKVQDQGVSLVG